MMKIQNLASKFLSSFLIFLAPLCLSAQSLQHTADSLFAENQYSTAFTLYDSLLQTGTSSPAMLLRMAYIAEGHGKYAQALYFLNRYYNQTGEEAAQSKMLQLAEAHELEGYKLSDIDYLQGLISRYRLYIILTLSLTIFLLFALLTYQKRRLKQKPVLSGLLMIVLLAMLYYFTNFSTEGSRAIIWQDATYLMEGPSAGGGVHSILPKGHRLEVLGQDDVWVRVRWQEEVFYIRQNALRRV